MAEWLLRRSADAARGTGARPSIRRAAACCSFAARLANRHRRRSGEKARQGGKSQRPRRQRARARRALARSGCEAGARAGDRQHARRRRCARRRGRVRHAAGQRARHTAHRAQIRGAGTRRPQLFQVLSLRQNTRRAFCGTGRNASRQAYRRRRRRHSPVSCVSRRVVADPAGTAGFEHDLQRHVRRATGT